MSTATSTSVPNHHANHPGFSGVSGLIAALSMIGGRRAVSRLAADVVNLQGDDRVIDIGCGPGTAAREAARRGAHVTGVDPAAVMRKVAHRLSRRRLAVTWLDGVAEALPLPDASATVVWSLATVHHWSDIGRGLGEARRVLRHGGQLLVIERRTHPGATGHASHGWTEKQAEAFANDCRADGFADVRVETRQPGGKRVLVVHAHRP